MIVLPHVWINYPPADSDSEDVRRIACKYCGWQALVPRKQKTEPAKTACPRRRIDNNRASEVMEAAVNW